jgi:hypothetical protein
MSENKMLNVILSLNGEESAAGQGKLRAEKLRNFYSSGKVNETNLAGQDIHDKDK